MISDMTRRGFRGLLAAMMTTAAVVRVSNAFTFPVFGGYDAYAHFTYIWFLASTGRVPLADSGWEFFQPPLYYAAMAALWQGAAGLDPHLRLRIGTALVALAGLGGAAVALWFTRRRLPAQPWARMLAAGSMLYLPMHLYSAGFVGNEGLNAALCSLSLFLTSVTAARPTARRTLLLGAVVGLAMLTKFTSVVVLVAAVVTLVADGILERGIAPAAKTLAVFLAGLLSVCGWFYARNVVEYGTPFMLSRHQLFLARVENSQLQGRRELPEYLLFDPGILYRPQWPRGLSIHSPRDPSTPYSALRESIPTGFFANTWFDGSGGFVLSPVTRSEASRRAGQLLLTLAVVPTLLVVVGVGATVAGLFRRRWIRDDVTMLAALAAMAVVVVHGTRSVPTQAAVKGTYLMPVSVAFSYFFAIGASVVARRHRSLAAAISTTCATLAVASVVVFTHGAFLSAEWLERVVATSYPQNMEGMLEFAGGRPEAARPYFERAARAGSHLGYENLAADEFDHGRLEAAEYFLRTAASRQPGQAIGAPQERRSAIVATQAEYANSLAVILHAGGRDDEALEHLARSRRIDPTIPESAFNLGVLRMLAGASMPQPDKAAELAAAAASFREALALDPAFTEAGEMLAATVALAEGCPAALASWTETRSAAAGRSRPYPVETGPGDFYAAGRMRRRTIAPLPGPASATAILADCRGA